MNEEDIKPTIDLISQGHRVVTMLYPHAERLIEYLEAKVDSKLIDNELSHEVDGLRLLFDIDKRLITIFKTDPVQKIAEFEEADCRVLIDMWLKAGKDPKAVDLVELEKRLRELIERDRALVAEAARLSVNGGRLTKTKQNFSRAA